MEEPSSSIPAQEQAKLAAKQDKKKESQVHSPLRHCACLLRGLRPSRLPQSHFGAILQTAASSTMSASGRTALIHYWQKLVGQSLTVL